MGILKQSFDDNRKEPTLIERISDGEILRFNDDFQTYSFINSEIGKPYQYSYDFLFNKKKGEFRRFNALNIDDVFMNCVDKIELEDTKYSVFAVQRIDLLLNDIYSDFLYVPNKNLEKRFNRYLIDDKIHEMGYTDIVGGPLNEEHTRNTWKNEVDDQLKRRHPENLIFYLRKDPTHVAARILISFQDFYGGLTQDEAIKKYGKAVFSQMTDVLVGISVPENCEGEMRISYTDLDYAFKKINGKETRVKFD
jgi:hypothetical protein